jgi:hypothetical protein
MGRQDQSLFACEPLQPQQRIRIHGCLVLRLHCHAIRACQSSIC